MSRRSRPHGRSSHSFQARGPVTSRPIPQGAQPAPVSFWSSLLDENLGSLPVVRQPFPNVRSVPLLFIPSSLPRGQIPRFTSRPRAAQVPGRTYSRLLAGLQRAQALPYGSTPCEARRDRRRALWALGIAGRRGLGRGKPRRLSLNSFVRCL